MFKKKIIFFILFSFSIFFINNFSNANEKIAFVDINYIFNNSSAGKKINKQINDKSKKLNSEFKNYKEKIDAEKKKLLTQKNVINEEEYKKKLLKLEKDIKEYNSLISKKRNDLTLFNNKARKEFSNQLRFILEEYSKNNSIGMILRKENLLIGKSNLDVTKGILELFDKNVKKISVQ